MLSDGRQYAFGMGENIVIAETQHRPAEGLQLDLSEVVSQYNVIPFVDAAVDFQDQPEPIAGEVSEVLSDRMLAAELVSVDLCAAKPLPQAALRQTSDLPLIARKSCAPASHDAIIASVSAGEKGCGLRRMPAGDPHPFALPIASLPEAQALSHWERGVTLPAAGVP